MKKHYPNLANLTIVKPLIKFLISKNKLAFTLLPNNWTDKEGNNLFHYAALNNSISLFNAALCNNADVNQVNVYGIAPIHNVIFSFFKEHKKENQECSTQDNKLVLKNNLLITCRKKWEIFYHSIVQKKDNIQKETVLSFDREILCQLITYGANVNQKILKKESDKITSNFISEHKQTPIEILIELFYSKILHPQFNDKEIFVVYEEIYTILSQAGANINFLENEHKIKKVYYEDAMEEEKKHIVSHFFISHMVSNSKFYALLPLLSDNSINFTLEDNSNNTLLHNLFSKMAAKCDSLQYNMVEDIFSRIYNNPSFDKKFLDIENSFRLKPLNYFKEYNDKTKGYKDLFNNFMLYHKLKTVVPLKLETKAKKLKL